MSSCVISHVVEFICHSTMVRLPGLTCHTPMSSYVIPRLLYVEGRSSYVIPRVLILHSVLVLLHMFCTMFSSGHEVMQAKKMYPVPEPPANAWVDREAAEKWQHHRQAGSDLYKHLVSLYAVCKLSAKDLCIACHYAAEAEVPGGDFSSIALRPDQGSTGNYQRHLDPLLPNPGAMYFVECPVTLRGSDSRDVQSIACLPPHEALAKELRADPSWLEQARAAQWPESYETNPLVVSAIHEGLPKPVPVAIYLDGVRYSAPLAGRTDSLLGIWVINAWTQKRHLFCTIRTNDFCRCGCRGWCTVFPMLLCCSWGLAALRDGSRPARKHDGSAFDLSDSYVDAVREFGQDLGLTAVVLWIKGDWAEVSHTLGLPSVTSKWAPCLFCECTKADMHEHYRSISSSSWPWPPRDEDYYENFCNSAEIVVDINSEADHNLIMRSLVYHKGRKGRGRQLTTPVRLESGIELQIGEHARHR